MKLTKFKYNLAKGSKAYHSGPAFYGKLKEYGEYGRPAGEKFIAWAVSACIWGAVALAILLLYLALTLPDIDKVTNQTRSPTITVLDRRGVKLATLNDVYGETVSVDSLPPHVWQAVVAIEDKRFFGHLGIDPRGFARALMNNIRADRIREGGSTITQQLAKNLFLNPRRALSRKIQELMLTLWLESKFSKEQILSLYLNRVSLVGGKYGISTAAEALFAKRPADLVPAESAILAAMLKAPTKYSPANNPEAARARAGIVLKEMRDQGYLSDREYEAALAYRYRPPEKKTGQTRYFIDYTLDEFSSLVGDVRADIAIHTTLDARMQQAAENIAKSYVEKEGGKYGFSQVASIFMTTDGAILSMVGGASYSDSQFNRATQMKRQPGSAFKPFVYLAALGYGIRPSDEFTDEPTELAGWVPKNHDERYLGKITMAEALEKSVNTVPVQIAAKIGLKSIVATAHRLGLVDRIGNDYTVILGTSDVTLVDLTAAYAAFGNKGRGVIPHAIRRVSSAGGATLYERKGSGVGKLVSDSEAADMNRMLRAVIEGGTGANADIPGANIRGKTGTSQDNRDAWFVGYNDDYAGGVWIGNDDNRAMSRTSYGGTIPARIFRAIMTYMLGRE
ncbi:MAG: PBP1A family penicillin-binding protein [Rickettsiales bacterium]|jgi:penicillin-binding protein 1A|nr:PBP1A family penicillin-binding protein [Rickettsiales bacterium]